MQIACKLGMFVALSALTTLSAAHAQNPQAPIVRGYQNNGAGPGMQSFESQPAAGVMVRSDRNDGVQIVTATGAGTELRIVQGKADITLHHPADHSQILVDLPGGQVSLLKDGLYTFNATTNTVRVLHGEALASQSANSASKGTKVKETQQLAFFGTAKLRAVNAYPYELTADLLPSGARGRGDGVGTASYRSNYYGDAPYYAGGYGYPYGYGYYPYGYSYPIGIGLGFGYYGGFGGFRGGGFRR